MSNEIKPGDAVVLIFPIPFPVPEMPPVGCRGDVAYDDFDGEVGVVFDGYPCPSGPGIDWITPKTCLAKINPESERETTEAYKNLKEKV